MSDYCTQCDLSFENAEVYLELNIETTVITHTEQFCCLMCLRTWVDNNMRDDEE